MVTYSTENFHMSASKIVSGEEIRNAILEELEGSGPENKVHWSELRTRFVEKGLCSNGDLIREMNHLLLPYGKIAGESHFYWMSQSG